MISRDRALRPSAAEVIFCLNSDLSTSQTAACASNQLNHDELLAEIEDLKRQIAEKDSIIEALTKKRPLPDWIANKLCKY